jgi:hypothetical protein
MNLAEAAAPVHWLVNTRRRTHGNSPLASAEIGLGDIAAGGQQPLGGIPIIPREHDEPSGAVGDRMRQ